MLINSTEHKHKPFLYPAYVILLRPLQLTFSAATQQNIYESWICGMQDDKAAIRMTVQEDRGKYREMTRGFYSVMTSPPHPAHTHREPGPVCFTQSRAKQDVRFSFTAWQRPVRDAFLKLPSDDFILPCFKTTQTSDADSDLPFLNYNRRQTSPSIQETGFTSDYE